LTTEQLSGMLLDERTLRINISTGHHLEGE
jgi:hypothetical protein